MFLFDFKFENNLCDLGKWTIFLFIRKKIELLFLKNISFILGKNLNFRNNSAGKFLTNFDKVIIYGMVDLIYLEGNRNSIFKDILLVLNKGNNSKII